jgi:hypothetical protein
MRFEALSERSSREAAKGWNSYKSSIWVVVVVVRKTLAESCLLLSFLEVNLTRSSINGRQEYSTVSAVLSIEMPRSAGSRFSRMWNGFKRLQGSFLLNSSHL